MKGSLYLARSEDSFTLLGNGGDGRGVVHEGVLKSHSGRGGATYVTVGIWLADKKGFGLGELYL